MSEGIYRQSYIRHRGRYLAFSLAVDKSTDNTDTVQLAIFIRGVKADVCPEELFHVASMHGTTTGRDRCGGKACLVGLT